MNVSQLQQQQRARIAPLFYEVHHWPHRGEVLVVHKEAHRTLPTLTWLTVAHTAVVERHDATVAVACGLAAAMAFDVPGACVVLHDRHGNMLSTPAGLGLPVTALRRAA